MRRLREPFRRKGRIYGKKISGALHCDKAASHKVIIVNEFLSLNVGGGI